MSAAAGLSPTSPLRAVVFELPYDVTQDRPLVLRIAGQDGEDAARIVLDL